MSVMKRAGLGGSLCVAALLFLGACGNGELELNNESAVLAEGTASSHHGDILYVLTQEELASRLTDGHVQLRPSHSFAGVLIHVAANGLDEVEVQYQRLDGRWSDWTALEGQSPEDTTLDGSLSIGEMSMSLRLRFGDAAGAVDFVRAEFLPEIEPEHGAHFDDDWDEALGESGIDPAVQELELARGGRYIPSSSANSASRRQYVAYEGAPRWSRSNCSGSFTSGVRKIADYIKENFRGARSYGGYSCRQNTANRSRMSVHGTGRAIDIFVPLDRGKADNDLGDPIANWLIENQEELGVQYLIWDRSSWSASRSGDGHRPYTGPHPHHDHLHVEFTTQAARQRTAWFSGPQAPPAGGNDVTCYSRTLGASVGQGECVQMSYGSCGGGTCNWAQCSSSGGWACTDFSNCSGTNHRHASCAQAPEPEPAPEPTPEPTPQLNSCTSRTLGRTVDHGACVQMNYNSCGGTGSCQWAGCNDGAWICQPESSCGGDKFAHTDCAPKPKESCYSRTLGRSIEDGGVVQMSYRSCGGTCRWAACDDGDWDCTTDLSTGTNYAHASCR